MITTLNGEQVLIWPFQPQEPMSEASRWATNVLQPYSAEQRISLLDKPRQEVGYSHILNKREFARASMYVEKWAANVFMLGLWYEQTNVGTLTALDTTIVFDTSDADYRDGGFALVWEDSDTYEAVEIDTVAGGQLNLSGSLVNSYSNAIVMPLRRGRLLDRVLELTRDGTVYATSNMTFTLLDGIDLSAGATPYTTHSTYEVMEDRPVAFDSLSTSVFWPQYVLDNGTNEPYADTTRSKGFMGHTATWTSQAGTDMYALREWLHSIKGRWKSFWMPSYNADLVLTADIGSADTTITITHIDFTTLYTTADIMILLNDGTRYYRAVTASVDNGTTETLTISALGANVAAADVDMISIMRLSRFDADRQEFIHYTNGQSQITIPVVQV